MLDLSIGSERSRCCDGATRRDFLRIGALGAFGVSLPGVLRAQSMQSSAESAQARSVILVYLGGGISHHDSFDLKPGAAEEIRGKYQGIATNVPGTTIGELLPMMSKVMDKVALVRSGSHNNDHHETATNWVLCGRFGSPFGDYPAIGAVVSHQLGFRGELPPYVSIPRNPSFTWELGKSAFLGGRYESFKTGDPNDAHFRVRDVAASETIAAKQTDRRKSLLKAVDQLAHEVEGNDQIATFDEFHRRAATIVLSDRAEARSRSTRKTRGFAIAMAGRRSVKAASSREDWWSATCGSRPSISAAGIITPRFGTASAASSPTSIAAFPP